MVPASMLAVAFTMGALGPVTTLATAGLLGTVALKTVWWAASGVASAAASAVGHVYAAASSTPAPASEAVSQGGGEPP